MSSYFPQVGDFVMIRPWDDMVKEFGTDSYGDIPTLPIAIFQSMKQYCGHFYTVERVTTTAAGSYQRQWISRQESTPGLPKTMFKSLTDSAAAS